MFCKWCGKKITNIGRPCPSCGKNQDPLENGNGFWDLCSKEADSGSTDSGGVVDSPKKDGSTHASAEQKATKRLWICALAATIAFLIIIVIVIGIGISEMGRCQSEISLLYNSINDINTLVVDSFAQLEEYHRNEQVIPETQPSVDTDAQKETEDDVQVRIDDLLENENIPFFETEMLSIASYEISSTPALRVYLAVGELLADKNAKLYWQKSNDLGQTWKTMLEDVTYIIVEPSETEIYRIICRVDDGDGSYTIYYTATVDPSSDLFPHTDETVPDSGNTPDETKSSATELETTDPMEDNATISAEDGGEAVG